MSSSLLARLLAIPNTLADRLPPFTRRLAVASHAAFAALTVLLGRPTTCRVSRLVSLFAYRGAYPVATRERVKFSWGHARIFPAVPSANTLVRRVNGCAFVSIVQTRPCPVFGRPVRLRGCPIDYGPAVLLMPFGFRLTTDTLPCPTFAGPREALLPRSWIWFSPFENQRDFNPHDPYTAQRTL